MCGATGAQNSIEQSQQGYYNTMMNQAQSVFGNSSKVFNDLVNTYSPVVAAGPNQQGYSPAELSAMNSSAITNAGNAYKNQKQALGDQAAASSPTSNMPGGSVLARQASLAENYGNQTAGALNQITQNNYAVGRQNWATAASGLAGATSVYNPATSIAGAANTAGGQASTSAYNIAQAANSPWQAAIGAVGNIAGAAAGGGLGGLGLGGAGGGGASAAENAATTSAQQSNYDPDMYSESGNLNAVGGSVGNSGSSNSGMFFG